VGVVAASVIAATAAVGLNSVTVVRNEQKFDATLQARLLSWDSKHSTVPNSAVEATHDEVVSSVVDTIGAAGGAAAESLLVSYSLRIYGSQVSKVVGGAKVPEIEKAQDLARKASELFRRLRTGSE
jgi:hypothetical protein